MLHIVHELQSLQGRVAALAASTGRFAVGRIEVTHKRRRSGTLDEYIKTAAVKSVALRLLVHPRIRPGETDWFPDIGWLIRHGAAATEIKARQTTHKNGIVTYLLGVEAHAWTTCQEAVFRILSP